MNIICNKPNRRAQLKCLRDYMNGLRQLNGKPIFKTIAKFKKQFEVTTAAETYQIATDINKTVKRPATDFDDFSVFRELLASYGGKTIRVMHLPDDASPGNFTEVDQTYVIPADPVSFMEWWNGMKWHWRVSDSTVFNDNNFTGNVYITESVLINPKRIQQSYLDNENHNCIFKPIIALCNKQINNPELKPATQSKYSMILNKLKKMMPKYKNGVPDAELDEVFKKLKIKMTLTLPFCEKAVIYGVTADKATMVVNYINTRLNHVEVAGEFYNNNRPIMLPSADFEEKYQSIIDANEFCLYQQKNGLPYAFKTIDNHYRQLNTDFDVFKKFETETALAYCSLDDVDDRLLSRFIRNGGHLTCSRINPKYKGNLKDYVYQFHEIDGVTAFAQFKHCSWYKGFMGKPTDFRKTDKIEGIGYYLIGNIDWTNATDQVKHIQKTFNIYCGRNIYISPELEFMKDNGLTFKIYGGCWGVRVDFEFTEEMFDKRDKIRNYSRWTGMCSSKNEYDEYFMKTDDADYAAHITETCMGADYNDGVVRFTIPKQHQYHKAHISGFIYGYQRINLMEQLMKMQISKILRINVDGIKYLDHEFELNKIFRHETITNSKINGFTMDDRDEGLITNINNCDSRDWFQFHRHFTKTIPRTHYDNELFMGPGGCGKTHKNLIDNGLIRPLYVANAYKLTRAKELEYAEYGVKTDVLANILSPARHEHVLKNFNTLIIDEASMVSEEARVILFKLYKGCKLIFCGDIGYQADPIEGRIMVLSAFQHITVMNENFRTNDPELLNLLQNLRNAIDSKADVYTLLDGVQRITKEQLVCQYKPIDMVLTHTLRTQDIYNKLLDVHEKYVITKSTDEYSRGEIFYAKPNTKQAEKRNAYTTHSVQGETFRQNIYIDMELINNKKLLYTACSRAKMLNQLYIIGN